MMKALTKKRNDKGFTLVELIVVIAILAVLMAILVPQYIQYVEKSRQGTDASALAEIKHACEIEAALSKKSPSKVVVTVKDGAVAANDIVVTDGDSDFLTRIQAITPNASIKLQSGAAKACVITINIDSTTGAVTWDGAVGTDKTTANFIDLLSKGTAKDTNAPVATKTE